MVGKVYMKFDLFYIIDHSRHDNETGVYEAGPFKSWNAAWEAKKQLDENWRYDVYSQTIEAKE